MQMNINLYLQICPSKQKEHLFPAYDQDHWFWERLGIFHSLTTYLKINKSVRIIEYTKIKQVYNFYYSLHSQSQCPQPGGCHSSHMSIRETIKFHYRSGAAGDQKHRLWNSDTEQAYDAGYDFYDRSTYAGHYRWTTRGISLQPRPCHSTVAVQMSLAYNIMHIK